MFIFVSKLAAHCCLPPFAPVESSQSPLAVALLGLEGVTGVFLGTDFITISKVCASELYSVHRSI